MGTVEAGIRGEGRREREGAAGVSCVLCAGAPNISAAAPGFAAPGWLWKASLSFVFSYLNEIRLLLTRSVLLVDGVEICRKVYAAATLRLRSHSATISPDHPFHPLRLCSLEGQAT